MLCVLKYIDKEEMKMGKRKFAVQKQKIETEIHDDESPMNVCTFSHGTCIKTLYMNVYIMKF